MQHPNVLPPKCYNSSLFDFLLTFPAYCKVANAVKILRGVSPNAMLSLLADSRLLDYVENTKKVFFTLQI
jgi:hypothetical protein